MREKVVDIVFANESEVKALYQSSDLATALDALRADATLAVVTQGENGAIAMRGAEMYRANAFR